MAVSTAPTTNKHTSNKTAEKKSVFENIEENFPSFAEPSSVVPKQTLNINNQVNQKNNNLNNNTNAPKVTNNTTNNTSNDLFLNDFPVTKVQKGKKKNKQNFQYKDNKQADKFEIDDSEENFEEKVVGVEKINKSDKDDKENKDSSKLSNLIENFNKFNSLDFFVKKENSQEENKTVEKSSNIKELFGESAAITTEKGKKTNKFTEYKEPEVNNLKSYLKNPNPTSNKDASKSNAAKIVDKLGKKTVFGKSNFDMDEAFPELK